MAISIVDSPHADSADVSSLEVSTNEAGTTRWETLFIVALALIPAVFSLALAEPFWTPKAALTILIGVPGLVSLATLVRRRDRAALAATAFLVSALVSTLASGAVELSFFGSTGWGDGWLFLACLAGIWATARRLGPSGRRTLETAVGVSIVVNAVVAWVGSATGFGWSVTGLFYRAAGLTGNPVHLAALSSGWMAVLLARSAGYGARNHRVRDVAAVFLVAGAVQLAGGRLGLALLAVPVCWALWRFRRKALLGVVAVAAGLALSIPGAASNVTGVSRLGATNTDGRSAIWEGGLRAAAARPLLGWGAGRFEQTSARYRPDRPESFTPARWVDSHNIVVQTAATLGALGVVLGALWMALAARRSGGPLLIVAVVIGLNGLLQPSSVVTSPIALAALGVAAPLLTRDVAGGGRRRCQTWPAVAGGVAMVMALALLVGQHGVRTATNAQSADALDTAASFLPPWPTLARDRALYTVVDDPTTALAWARHAVSDDPDDVASLEMAGALEARYGSLDSARTLWERALLLNPYSKPVLCDMAKLARETGRALPASVERHLASAGCGATVNP